MAKYHLIAKACELVESSILRGDGDYLKLFHRLVLEEVSGYSNRELREIIGSDYES